MLYYVEAPAEMRMQLQGFTGTYTSLPEGGESVVRKDGNIDFVWPDDAPISLPFHAEWSGALAAEAYGPYQFKLNAPGFAELFIDEVRGTPRAGGGPRRTDRLKT